MKRFLVLDQNYLRSEKLKQIISTEQETHFVIPDSAMVEMCKSPSWEITTRQSLQALSQCPNRVHVAICMGEAVRFEMQHCKSVEGKLLDRKCRALFRDILADTKTEKEYSALTQEKMLSIQDLLNKDELNNTKNKASLNRYIAAVRANLTEDMQKNLKDRHQDNEYKRELITKLTIESLLPFLQEELKLSIEKSKHFLKKKPIAFRFIWLRTWLSIDWFLKGGIEDTKPSKVTNDFLDHDYILTATFFNGILSEDKRVNLAYQDIMQMLKK